MPPKKNNKTKNGNGATLDFESQLWAAADKLRGHMDASEYKHVALVLIILKYISDYNEETFIVRHAYFTGAEEPYDKLKRALRAEIDESAWSALYTTTSISFEKPKSGKIAVKVINHYGDEVLKVFEV
jgi:type I restriction-modification system DNA methylase subunit